MFLDFAYDKYTEALSFILIRSLILTPYHPSIQESKMREKLRMEYNELVHNMFSTCDTLRHRFDEFRYYDVFVFNTRHYYANLPVLNNEGRRAEVFCN